MFKLLSAILFFAFIATSARAEDINYDALNKEGYGDVSKIIQSMTPEQRAELMRQATLRAQELEKMSPEEREALQKQLRSTADTIQMDKIDPAKLDPAKTKDTAGIQKDLNTYDSKYKQGKINNAVIKPLPAQNNAAPNR